MSRLTASIGSTDLASADLVIEAVFEDLELKQAILSEAESTLRDDAIFASNTSSIPIARIARASSRPERVVGMHYFSRCTRCPSSR
jgi:3-hydroxyacyl-CoA dehydrogenase / enoyl-CoA hydratase / 3-hydroxybutyryl-CoA epimerase